MTVAMKTRVPHIRSMGDDEFNALIAGRYVASNMERRIIAALICDERIDVAFRAGLVMSLAARPGAHP